MKYVLLISEEASYVYLGNTTLACFVHGHFHSTDNIKQTNDDFMKRYTTLY